MNIFGNCSMCKRENTRMTGKVCTNCYKKYFWKRKKFECKECDKTKFIQAKGFCNSCYSKLSNNYRDIKKYNVRKFHNLDLDTYFRIVNECIICGFKNIVHLHHIDYNHDNNSESNLIGLCPNHHGMIHKKEHKLEFQIF